MNRLCDLEYYFVEGGVLAYLVFGKFSVILNTPKRPLFL